MSASRSRSSSTARCCRRPTSTSRSLAAAPRFPAASRRKRQPARDRAAFRRAAGRSDGGRGAHRRARISARIRSARACSPCRSATLALMALMIADLWPLRRLCQSRADAQRADAAGHHGGGQHHADPAGHRRLRADHRRGGRRQRADQRTHPRRAKARAARRRRGRESATRKPAARSSMRTSPTSSPPCCCSCSAPARCAASRWC